MRIMTKTMLAAGCWMTMTTGALAADVVLGVPNWASARATSNILKIVIEENLGLDVELQDGTNVTIFEAMDRGSINAHPQVWMPNQQNLYDKYVAERKSVIFNQKPAKAEQGICVPRYVSEDMGVSSVYDLTDPDKAAIFDNDADGKPDIWIGAPGWASTPIDRIRAKSYGYDQVFDLKEMDETIAWGQASTALDAKKPWIGFCYKPHFSSITYDIVFLDEPDHDPATWTVIKPNEDPDWLAKSNASTAWKSAQLHLAYSAVLREKQPEVFALFENYSISANILSEAGYAVSIKGMDPADFARQWVDQNQDTIAGWLSR